MSKTLYILGRKFFTYDNNVMLHNAINIYPKSTVKKRILFSIISLFSVIGILSFFIKDEKNEAQIPIKKAQNKLNCDDFVIIWPNEKFRRRLYVYLYSNNKIMFFGKIGLDVDNSNLINKEKNNLKMVSNMKSFKTPIIEFYGLCDDMYYLFTSLIPSGSCLYAEKNSLVDPVIIEEVKTLGSARCLLKKQVWFELLKYTILRKKLNVHINKKEISVCFAHGDMGSENIFLDKNNKVWIVDWERAGMFSPVLTDEFAYYLGMNNVEINKLSHIDKHMGVFLSCNDAQEVICALLYLDFLNYKPAVNMVKYYVDN
jgi:hypothetical protein